MPIDKLSNPYRDVESPRDLPDATLAQISHFFAHYKDLEPGKWVKVMGPEETKAEILASMARFKRAKRKPRS